MNQFMVAFELIKCFARAGQQQIKQNISFRSLRMGGMIVLLIAAALAPKRTVQPTSFASLKKRRQTQSKQFHSFSLADGVESQEKNEN